MDNVRESVAASYDPALAVSYGQFVNVAYQMYGSDPANPTPAPPSSFPAGYRFFAWVQMKDFLIESGDWTFYGLIAQSTSDTNKFLLAIRGTDDLTEWWDDLLSMAPVPWEDFGSVGYGFARIYQTLRIVDYMVAEALYARGTVQSPRQSLTFAQQVAAAVQRHAPTVARPGEREAAPPVAAVKTIVVVGHSLGSALATLYVADNAATSPMKTPLICTFASPRVGDPVFAAKFNQLGITSWRIVNDLDVVPKVPVIGFAHVETLHLYNSGSSVAWSLECWHSLATYLHLLDAKQPLDPGCVWPPKIAASASLRVPSHSAEAVGSLAKKTDKVAISVPRDGGATINITIKIGGRMDDNG
jgi:hypothetical protein